MEKWRKGERAGDPEHVQEHGVEVADKTEEVADEAEKLADDVEEV